MIHVIATITAQPGRRDELLGRFRDLVPQVQAEQGCIEYGATVDVATQLPPQQLVGDDAFVVVEKWDSVEALQAHLMAPHMLEYRAGVKDLIAGTSLLVLEPA
ncbi:MAG: putative quinol monooxygenase [Pirellulales bacterium]